MKKTVASIMIPTYNRATLLKQALDSCLNQTVHCEIIVCDHGSTDNTPQVMETYRQENITYIRREKDFGPHFAWLEAALHCSHPWIHIQYDDDWIEPGFMEKLLALTGDDVGFVCSDAMIFFDTTGKYEPSVFFKNLSTGLHNSSFALKRLMRIVISPGACLLRKEEMLNNLFVGKVPLAKDHYHGVGPDLLFSLSASVNYPKFGYVQEQLTIFREHAGSITTDAQNNNKRKSINNAYNEARKYAKVLKVNNGNGFLSFVFHLLFGKKKQ